MMLPVRSALLPLAVLAAVLLTAVPASSRPAPPRPDDGPDTARIEVRLLGQVNHARRQAGCRRLKPRAGLHGSASAHSAAMAAQRSLSHQVAGEAELRERIAAAGYRDAALMGEVIAMGPMSARGALDRWLASPPHRALLLDCRMRLVGLGVQSVGSQLWWTIDLVRRR
ncbi:CAP domain-containing protein [Nocardioides nitrophenolicus]|uniref:CAP domain-containing protein n=1 Tax=Nocardioides nitrophenolicus TaxID=60489 RepID=UPI00195DF7B4|nr:CAP domain-containing protein [Nocardioides nitrophenolicus]MBM7517836.1 uncharacterized protein YkwD [Nocardioides nitrophenolicus]